MIITRAPLRISFLGGGSDLPAYYNYSVGRVLSAAIDKYAYAVVHTTQHGCDDTTATSPLAAACVEGVTFPPGYTEIDTYCDVPCGTGLGSSSALAVAVIAATSDKTRAALAEAACRVELDVLKSPIGKQDQYAAAFGGMRVYTFSKEEVAHGLLYHTWIQEHLVLFYTGLQRSANAVLAQQTSNMESAEHREHVYRMVEMVNEGVNALHNKDVKAFGRLLSASWELKKKLADNVTNGVVDAMYSAGMAVPGVYGGKLLGAGGGGYMLFCCDKSSSKQRLRSMFTDELKFQFAGEGCRAIYSRRP